MSVRRPLNEFHGLYVNSMQLAVAFGQHIQSELIPFPPLHRRDLKSLTHDDRQLLLQSRQKSRMLFVLIVRIHRRIFIKSFNLARASYHRRPVRRTQLLQNSRSLAE